MVASIIKFVAGFISKELLVAALREIVLESAIELLAEFVKKTNNPYDDKLVEHFRAFVDKRSGEETYG